MNPWIDGDVQPRGYVQGQPGPQGFPQSYPQGFPQSYPQGYPQTGAMGPPPTPVYQVAYGPPPVSAPAPPIRAIVRACACNLC